MEKNEDQPLALRRPKRRASVLSPIKPVGDSYQNSQTTPSKRRAQKKVRFSDSNVPSTISTLGSTGLTPAVRRASLGTPRTRRIATPARISTSNVVQFTPLRQVLDDRCKRRIRRNGLSKEMNDYETDKKDMSEMLHQIEEKDRELQKLKLQLQEAQQVRSDGLHSETQSRHDEIEAELDILRQSFGIDASDTINWDHITRNNSGPDSDGGDTILIYEDENTDVNDHPLDHTDALAMGLELESARQAKEDLFRSSRSFSASISDLHFKNSPVKRRSEMSLAAPGTPRTFYHDLSKQLRATTNRAEDAELALQALEGEVRSLGFSQEGQSGTSADLTAIANHFRQMRLELERIMPGETSAGFENSALFPEVLDKIKSLLQQLKDREGELKSMRDQQRSLKGNFEHAIVAAEKATAKVKELENVIDHTAEETLEMRMRAQALEKDVVEKDSTITTLGAALNKYRDEVNRHERLISQVEIDQLHALEEVKQASRQELEEKLSDMGAKVAAEERGRRAAEESAVSRLAKINELDSSLSAARQRAETVEQQLSNLKSKLTSTTKQREEEVGALNSRISNMSTALASTNAEIEKLHSVIEKLEDRYHNEVEQGRMAAERMQQETLKTLMKVNEVKKSYVRASKVRLANWELESDDMMVDESGLPMTPASLVRFADMDDEENDIHSHDDSDHIPGSVEMSRGKKHSHRQVLSHLSTPCLVTKKKIRRRRYDSGIGMDSLSEADIEDDTEDSGVERSMVTPDLSSDADIDVHVDADMTAVH